MASYPRPTSSTGPCFLNEEKKGIARNIGGRIVRGGPATSPYLDLISKVRTRTYLKATSHYSKRKKTWTMIKKSARTGDLDKLRSTLTGVINDVINTLGQQGDLRVAVDNGGKPLDHYGTLVLRSTPSIAIKAEGPSFETREKGKLEYSNIASCIEVQLDARGVPIPDQAYELGVKIKQQFAHQPNRNFAKGLFLTEPMATFFHFDCAGVMYTEPIDYHQHPQAFIRMFLGLSTQDESLLGFDTSIRWTRDAAGRRAEGIMEVRRPGGDGGSSATIHRNIQLVSREQMTNIVGRGTTCWTVVDPETKETHFVKDQFRNGGHEAEGDFLILASGVPGTVQAVASEPARLKTSTMRALGTGRKVREWDVGKVQSRLVMRKCGKCITANESERQLLGAIRDVIIAHCKLFCIQQILHRDISFNNILLGARDAIEGWRGFLIDFDLAILKENLNEYTQFCGTPKFMSINVLRALFDAEHWNNVALHQDHHDDLQSIFYLLLLIVTCMGNPKDETGIQSSAQGALMYKVFEGEDRIAAANFKAEIFARDSLDPRLVGISEYWSENTKTLLKEFFKALRGDVMWKESLRWSPGFRDEQIRMQKDKIDNAEKLYDRIIKAFDKALEALDERGETEAQDAAAAPKGPLTQAATVNLPVILLEPEVPLERKRKVIEERRDDKDIIFGSFKGDGYAAKDNPNENDPERQIKRTRRAVPGPTPVTPTSPRKVKACTQEQ